MFVNKNVTVKDFLLDLVEDLEEQGVANSQETVDFLTFLIGTLTGVMVTHAQIGEEEEAIRVVLNVLCDEIKERFTFFRNINVDLYCEVKVNKANETIN